MPSQEAEELVLLAIVTTLALSKDKSVFEMTLVGSFLSTVAGQLLLLAVVQEEEELRREKREEAKKEEAAEARLAALEKSVKELKDLFAKPTAKK